LEVYVVRGVDGLGNTEDAVRHRHATPQERVVFDVIHTVNVSIAAQDTDGEAYSSEAVCSIATTLLMTSKTSSGTRSQTLNA
jgi:hypothetical protein